MHTFLLVVLSAALIWVLIKMFFKKSNPEPVKPVQDLSSLPITEARVRDNISISGAGDDFTDLEFTVDRQNRYESGARQWMELSGLYRERRVYLEAIETDDVETRLTKDPTKLTLDQLGVSEEDLGEMDERQNPSDFFEYDGKQWMYHLSKEMGFFRNGETQGTGFYCWEFLEQGGSRVLTVKKYEGEPFGATIALKINSRDITVYRGA